MISFTEITLKNHTVFMEKDSGKKEKFTVFQRSRSGKPLTGTGKFFYRLCDLIKYLGSVDPNEKRLFEEERNIINQITESRQIRRLIKPGIITSKLPRGGW